MSASARAPLWKMWLRKYAPFLFRKCPGYNFHWAWDRVCVCCENGRLVRIKGDRWVRAPFED